MTLKTGVMMLKIQLTQETAILNCNNISHCCFFFLSEFFNKFSLGEHKRLLFKNTKYFTEF